MGKENLLKRALTKLKEKMNMKTIKKAIAGLIITASIFTAVGCSCANTPTSPNIDNSVSMTQSIDQSQTSSQTQTVIDYSKYSPLLQKVLKDDEINDHIEEARTDFNYYNNAVFDPHPYAFLEEQGHNVDAIKNGDIECRTVSYIPENEPNSLYMLTYVENNAVKPYLTQYILKYNLTDAEVKDYNFLHGNGGTYYIQAVFMNDMISKTKNVEIVSKNNIYKSAHEEMQEAMNGQPYIKNIVGNTADVILKSYSEETQSFDVLVIPKANADKRMSGEERIVLLNLRKGDSNLKIEDGIFAGPNRFGQFDIHPQATNEETEIRLYYPQETGFNNTVADDLTI